MTAEAGDRVARTSDRPQDFVDRAFEIVLDKGGDCPVEDDGEAWVLDVPAHDPLGVGPELFGRIDDGREPLPAALDNRGRGAVAKDRGGDDGRRVVAVEADRDGTGLDRHEQPAAPGIARRKACGGRESVHSARAAQAEDRNPPGIFAQAQARRCSRFEAGRRNAGGGDGDDSIDFGRRQARLLDRGRCRVHEQLLGRLDVQRVAVMPAMPFLIPGWRSDDVPLGNAGVVEHARQPVEQGFPAPECAASALLGFVLADDLGRHRCCQRQEADGLHDVTLYRNRH